MVSTSVTPHQLQNVPLQDLLRHLTEHMVDPTKVNRARRFVNVYNPSKQTPLFTIQILKRQTLTFFCTNQGHGSFFHHRHKIHSHHVNDNYDAYNQTNYTKGHQAGVGHTLMAEKIDHLYLPSEWLQALDKSGPVITPTHTGKERQLLTETKNQLNNACQRLQNDSNQNMTAMLPTSQQLDENVIAAFETWSYANQAPQSGECNKMITQIERYAIGLLAESPFVVYMTLPANVPTFTFAHQNILGHEFLHNRKPVTVPNGFYVIILTLPAEPIPTPTNIDSSVDTNPFIQYADPNPTIQNQALRYIRDNNLGMHPYTQAVDAYWFPNSYLDFDTPLENCAVPIDDVTKWTGVRFPDSVIQLPRLRDVVYQGNILKSPKAVGVNKSNTAELCSIKANSASKRVRQHLPFRVQAGQTHANQIKTALQLVNKDDWNLLRQHLKTMQTTFDNWNKSDMIQWYTEDHDLKSITVLAKPPGGRALPDASEFIAGNKKMLGEYIQNKMNMASNQTPPPKSLLQRITIQLQRNFTLARTHVKRTYQTFWSQQQKETALQQQPTIISNQKRQRRNSF